MFRNFNFRVALLALVFGAAGLFLYFSVVEHFPRKRVQNRKVITTEAQMQKDLKKAPGEAIIDSIKFEESINQRSTSSFEPDDLRTSLSADFVAKTRTFPGAIARGFNKSGQRIDQAIQALNYKSVAPFSLVVPMLQKQYSSFNWKKIDPNKTHITYYYWPTLDKGKIDEHIVDAAVRLPSPPSTLGKVEIATAGADGKYTNSQVYFVMSKDKSVTFLASITADKMTMWPQPDINTTGSVSIR